MEAKGEKMIIILLPLFFFIIHLAAKYVSNDLSRDFGWKSDQK